MYQPPRPGVILSRFQAAPLLEARQQGVEELEVSLDLNLSQSRVRLMPEGVVLPLTDRAEAKPISWHAVSRIAKSANGCFLLREDGFWKIQIFSELTNRPYSLMPTPGAPTVLNAGFTMHRIKGTTPEQDTRRKIEVLGRTGGRVLDTNTGLGYTAIESARQGASVVTVELDPAMLELASYNPWSRELFDNPAITSLARDALDVLEELQPESFDRIIHDPPTLSLAGELYSTQCYAGLFRVLTRGGSLFHYTGNPDTRQGARTLRQAVKGLSQVGFSKVAVRPEAFGVTASK